MDIQTLTKRLGPKHRFFKKFKFFLISLLFVISKTPFVFAGIQFPEPEGPYSVGYKLMEFTDGSREDPYNPELLRRLKVTVYYPSNDARKTEPYGDEEIVAWKTELREDLASEITPEELELIMQELGGVQVFKSKDATPAPEPFPVILFEHGLGITAGSYQRMLLELVSHGYVVIAPGHPYISSGVIFEDGTEAFFKADQASLMSETFETAFNDTQFILKQIEAISSTLPSMDLTKIGMMGHSLGGGTTVKTTRHDSRILAGIGLDAPTSPDSFYRYEGDKRTVSTLDSAMEFDPEEKLGKPFLHLLCDKPMCDFSTVYPDDNIFKATVKEGTEHNSFTDYALLKDEISVFKAKGWDFDTGPSEASSYQGEMSGVIKSFFDKFLKGVDVDLMQLSSDVITVETAAE